MIGLWALLAAGGGLASDGTQAPETEPAGGAGSLQRDLGAPPPERGIALGLFSADPEFDYTGLIKEIRDAGATHVSVVWVWWQKDLGATEVRSVPRWSATQAQVVAALEAVKALGMHATLFPIVRLQDPDPGQWRGRIAPDDEDRWWQSYTEYILLAALLAKHAGSDRLSVGSELLTREPMRDRWLELVDRVRLRAPELELLYSANWDHYRPVAFWDAVDVVGLTGYWELTRDLDASADALAAAWRGPQRELREWAATIGRPLVFTEVGYPSLEGGAAWPWDETRKAAVDPEEQRRAYEAFVRAWSDVDYLQGVYFWNWFGFGGPEDGNYTPRGKPAQGVIESWYGRSRERAQPGPEGPTQKVNSAWPSLRP